MNELDFFILAALVPLALIGYLQGFIVGAASLVGIALGGTVGIRVAKAIIERSPTDADASVWGPVLGLGIAALITIIAALSMQDLAANMRERATYHGAAAYADHFLGAVLLVIVGLLMAWFIVSAAMGSPSVRDMRKSFVDSKVMRSMNELMPPAGPLLGVISSYDPFPKFQGGEIDAAPPDESLPRGVKVRNAAKSVVRIVGSACGFRVTGTGWVVRPGYVVTNAHVVAGASDINSQVRQTSESHRSDVVYFDQNNDLAILRVPNLNLAPLKMVPKLDGGEAAVIVGFPENHGLVSTAGRIDDERTVNAHDIYEDKLVKRRIVTFRGLVRHGNSGGPLLDSNGDVLGTVFASTVDTKTEGGYGIPNNLVTEAVGPAMEVPQGYGVVNGRCVA